MNAFVGRSSKIISQPEGSPYFAVHIIMERHTGKTMDAFIEFNRAAEATYVVNQIQKRIMQGRPPKVGDRQVEVLFISQEELMGELFQRAKNVRWEGSAPVVLDNPQMFYPGVEAAGFTGFLQGEEVVMVVKHVETPFRVSPEIQLCYFCTNIPLSHHSLSATPCVCTSPGSQLFTNTHGSRTTTSR